jgi:hypothetical protein
MITTGKGPDPRVEINAGTGEVARSSGTFVEICLRNVYGKLGISLRREQLRLDGSLRPPMAWLTGRMEALPHQEHVVVKPCRSSGSTGTCVVDTLTQAVGLARVPARRLSSPERPLPRCAEG